MTLSRWGDVPVSNDKKYFVSVSNDCLSV